MSSNLFPPRKDQAYFDVSAIEAGLFYLPDSVVVSPATPGARRYVPSLAFVLRHSVSGTYVLFDLGVRKDSNNLAPAAQARVEKMFAPIKIEKDVAESLQEHGVIPRDINTIIISHLHWCVFYLLDILIELP